MNEKERIIELVRQNIITMDEALKLLEASGQATATATASEAPQKEEVTTEPAVEETSTTKSDLNAMVGDVVKEASSLVDSAVAWIKTASQSAVEAIKEDDAAESSDSEVAVEPEVAGEEVAQEEPSMTERLEKSAEELAQVATRLSAELDEQQAAKQKKEEALVIARQRYRELEILAELDDLSDEMHDQQNRLATKISELEQEIQTIDDTIESTKADQKELFKSQVNQYKEDVKQFVNEAAGNAAQFGSQAGKQGRKWSKLVTKGVKTLIDSIGTKEMSMTVNVPWVKTATIEHHAEYPGADVSILDLSFFNGDVELSTHSLDTIEIESEITFLGKHEATTWEAFQELSTLSIDGDRLVFHVPTPLVSVDAVIYLPRKMYDHIKLVNTNGDITVANIEAKDLYFEAKNGDIDLERIDAVMTEFDVMNGDIALKDVTVRDIVVKNINGDFRVKGNVANATIEAVNGDVYITKTNAEDAAIRAKLVNGDIKVAIPENVNLDAECATSFGDLHHRLSNLDEETGTKRQMTYRRLLDSQAPNVTLKAVTKTGDIYLKDSE